MNTTMLAGTSEQTRTAEPWWPMLRVMAWELRRFCASRLFWLQALGYFVFSLMMTWAIHAPENFGVGVVANGHGVRQAPLSGFVAGTSTRGLLDNWPIFLVVMMLFLPFITVDGVTRDLQRRTHELVLTTAVPTRAYVWGRYLTVLLMGLGLALLMLIATLGMGTVLHLAITNFPAPVVSQTLVLWVGIVLSATVLVTSVGFAIGTLYPQLSMVIKVAIMVTWIFVGVVLPLGLANSMPSSVAMNWDPTSGITAHGLLNKAGGNSSILAGITGPSVTTEAQLQQRLLAAENKLPSLSGWYGPHLLLAGLSLLLVVIAGFAYKRSREVLN